MEEETLDEDLLDFEFDDLPAEDLESTDIASTNIEATKGDSIPEEDVVELVDVVEEGDMPETLTDGDKPEDAAENFTLTMEAGDFLKEFDEDTSDLSLKIKSDSNSIVDDLESFTEPDPELDLGGSDLEGLADDEAILELEDLVGPEDMEDEPESDLQGDIPEPDIQESDVEGMAEEMSPDEAEDPAKTPVSDNRQAEATVVQEEEEAEAILERDVSTSKAGDAGDAAPSGEQRFEISHEKIESVIREVVAEVVERVARETMADVAEKVIGEAIDALKKSLESPSE